MINIGICDDDNIFLSKLSNEIDNLLSDKKIKYNIHTYYDGNLLIEDNKRKVFHILFLDIEMPCISGIEIANHFRNKNPYIIIIFITNRDDLVFESIQYKPFRFIRKKYYLKEIEEAVSSLVRHINNESQYYTFATKNSTANIKFSDIIYMESKKHYIYVYCTNNEYCVRGTMNTLEIDFETRGFVRIHSGYLVNFRYIFSVNKTDVVLDNQKNLPLSRHRMLEVKQKLQLFTRGMV